MKLGQLLDQAIAPDALPDVDADLVAMPGDKFRPYHECRISEIRARLIY